jgi:hypothetical protein
MEAILFPKGQNKCYLVFGSIFFDDNLRIELKVNQPYDTQNDAINCYKTITDMFPENSDIGIQEHIVNGISVQ